MPMSLRINRKKKEVFQEAEARRPAKRLKIDTTSPPTKSSTPQIAASEPVSAQTPLDSPYAATEGTVRSSLQQIGVRFLNSNASAGAIGTGVQRRSTPRRDLQGVNKGSIKAQNTILNNSSAPPSSSVPSLATDIDTSDDSLSSQSDQQHRFPEQYQSQSRNTAKGQIPAASNGNSVTIFNDRVAGQRSTDTEWQRRHDQHSSNLIIVPPSISVILRDASLALQEMETGHHGSRYDATKGDTTALASGMDSPHPIESRNLPDGLPTDLPAPDLGLVSILQGVISELATGTNYGHGIAYLSAHAAHHQFMNQRRFIDCLVAVLAKAVPQVNTFVASEDAAALKAIYKALERRLPPSELPPPTPPPGHMVVRHPFPQHIFHPIPQGLSFPGPPIPLVQSNGPPLIKLAPKRRDKATTKEVISGQTPHSS